MTALAEKMKAAGVDTIGARFTAACQEGVRRHPDSSIDAWRYVGTIFGHEFIRGIMADMQGPYATRESASTVSPGTPLSRDNHPIASKPHQPRVIPPERLEKRRQLQQLVRSKYKNSANVSWSDVGWHELSGLKRDGHEAAALMGAGPSNVPNDGRTVGDVLGIKQVDNIIAKVREIMK